MISPKHCAPKHVGIIMDGNGRWAAGMGQPRTYGHIKGARVAKKVIQTAAELGVEHLTLYAFSTENWARPKTEVLFLMRLLERYLTKQLWQLIRENVRVSVIGDLAKLPLNIVRSIHEAMKATAQNSGLHLILALSYGSRFELTQACRKLAEKVELGEVKPGEIDEFMVEQQLMSFPAPSLDLVIRTSGEMRLSNFLLWQAAYAELHFTKTLWPEFSIEEFKTILHHYSTRERRFGRINAHEVLTY
jgi:undecaprenyl diphosphate synthase